MPRPAASLPPPSPDVAALLSRLADALPWPLLVLQPDGGLVHANRAGRQLLAAARPLRCDTLGHVTPAQAAQRAAFQDALARARLGQTVPLRWPGRSLARQGLLQALPGDADPALLLLALDAAETGGLVLPLAADAM